MAPSTPMSPPTALSLTRFSLTVTILEALLAPGTILVIAAILETEAEDHKFKASLDNLAYEKQRGAKREEQKKLQRAAAQDQVRGFLEKEAAIVSRPLNPFTSKVIAGTGPDDTQPGPSVGPPSKDKDKALPSFWIPSLTPEAKATKLEKPSRIVTCPMSGKPLRMSDLTPVRFTPLDDSVDRVGLITRSERYVCAVTRDSLSNATPCAVLRPSGAVVTLECVEKLIRKDMVDPVNGDKLTERDIIVLQRGGTGFAGSGVKLQAEKSRPVMQA
ncbi:nitric oxide synthase-interacting protein isoform X2 [Marmota flaviventris]|uniref:nitric oxide synthase-interacting protein isoform X2 n=1 Tax=Marmota flaviventris TaxID=93162 RepID=UPI003A86C26A